jgi:hypothetical protein
MPRPGAVCAGPSTDFESHDGTDQLAALGITAIFAPSGGIVVNDADTGTLTSRNASGGKIIRPGTSDSALKTFTVRRNPHSTQWVLESISD